MTAPTNALTERQHELLNFFEQIYLLDGQIPSRDTCVNRRVCSAKFYDDCLSNDAFREGLSRRSIKLADPEGPVGALTEHQLIVANALLTTYDNRSRTKKLRELNCSPAQYEAWLRDPAYRAYIQQRAENKLGDSQWEAHEALLDRVRSGDTAAIKYYNEITGRYVPNATDKVNVEAVLMRVLEIIQRHVQDPEIASSIADDLLALSATLNPAAEGNRQTARVLQGHAIASSVGASNGSPVRIVDL